MSVAAAVSSARYARQIDTWRLYEAGEKAIMPALSRWANACVVASVIGYIPIVRPI
jgi:hypothetical protein